MRSPHRHRLHIVYFLQISSYFACKILMDPAEEQRLFRLLQVDATLQQEALPERKADALRILAFELQLSELSGCPAKLGPCATNIFQEQYENIVDCSDETSGLGNFAPGALSLCATNRNERDKWTSALTQNTLSTMRCVKDFLTRYQSESRKIVPHLDSKPVRSTSSELATCSGGPIFDSLATRSEMIPSARGCDSAVRVPTFSWKTFSERPHASSPDVQTESLQSSSFPLTGQKAGIHHSRGATTHDDLDDNPDEAEGQGPSKCVSKNAFRTAREQLVMDQVKTYGQCHGQPNFSYGSIRKSLGTRRGPSSRFIPPVLTKDSENDAVSSFGSSKGSMPNKSEEPVDERLKGIEPKIIELISNEIMDHRPQMDWEDIAGLQFAKKTIKEIVVWPMLRPDIFTGLRGPPKGLLLFGPPGTGKTLIGKCIASQSKSTFFCISASSLTSKWVGEGEKMVRALFAVARCHQPAVIFIDEVDSLLAQRSEGEHESSRRIKTEFLVQLDGATTDCEDRILVIGATNRPQEIDEAARRRFVKRLYIPLPELVARVHIVTQLMAQQHCQLTQADITLVGQRTEGYSGADMASLCREAALGPIRTIPLEQIEHIHPEQVPPITLKDFEAALPQVRPSVSDKDLEVYIKWNNTFGSFGQG